MNPPRSPGVDVRSRAICDRLDILVDAQARTNQVLADLVLALNAVLLGTAGTTFVTARPTVAPKTDETLLYARQLRDLAAALDPDDARREAGRQVDFGAGKPGGRS